MTARIVAVERPLTPNTDAASDFRGLEVVEETLTPNTRLAVQHWGLEGAATHGERGHPRSARPPTERTGIPSGAARAPYIASGALTPSNPSTSASCVLAATHRAIRSDSTGSGSAPITLQSR